MTKRLSTKTLQDQAKAGSVQNGEKVVVYIETHVEGSALSLERVDDIERSDGLSLCVFSVGDRVSNDVYNTITSAPLINCQARLSDQLTLQEDLEDTSSLLTGEHKQLSVKVHNSRIGGIHSLDQTRDTLYTTSACKTTDSRLCDSLDIVAQDLAVSFGAAFAESLSAWQQQQRQ
jgi:hypothetical protein